MPFHQESLIRYFTFGLFDQHEVVHAIFTRHGGVSPDPWRSLNVGGVVGDQAERVIENRRRSFAVVDRDPQSMFDAWQVHGAGVLVAEAPRSPRGKILQGDVILTNQPGVTLYMRFADCVPILLYDPVQHVIGLVHAGWLGTVRKATQIAVDAMCSELGSSANDIHAGIGPSIGPDHYTVRQDVISRVQVAFGEQARSILMDREGQTYLDLWEANRIILQNAGVRVIENAGICTACHLDDWYSHRGEHGRTGRFGVLIGLL